MIEELKVELELKFPEYEFSTGKRIYGECIIVKKSKYVGADIFLKKNGVIKIMSGIPENKNRLLLGGGVVLLKMFTKDYSEVSDKIYKYLIKNNKPIKYVK